MRRSAAHPQAVVAFRTSQVLISDTRSSGTHPQARNDITPATYLRAAQAYMLISMPTGTSTIFGAFQAIVLSFEGMRDIFVLSIKLSRREKFASGIFCFDMTRFDFCRCEGS
jgi:hypothetical protein